jgi:hypothetical protein
MDRKVREHLQKEREIFLQNHYKQMVFKFKVQNLFLIFELKESKHQTYLLLKVLMKYKNLKILT